ncbi:hypothetical protein F5880DRAFT_1511347 [Lentinula raphanica]|nr:hypothetical protein F5880DRAFT_1511347 [Lentinula raphanica]
MYVGKCLQASLHPNLVDHYHEVIPDILQYFLPPTKTIQSLSLVCCTGLRQISLPFLFACVWVNRSMGASRFGDHCMANVEFHCLKTILIPSFKSLPPLVSVDTKLSKIIVHSFFVSGYALIAGIVPYVHKVHIARLSVSLIQFHGLTQENLVAFSRTEFIRLQELPIAVEYCSDEGLPWLPSFVSAHCPGLQKIVFLNDGYGTDVWQGDEPIGPFVIQFDELVAQEQRLGMEKLAFDLKRVSVSPQFDLETQRRSSIYADMDTWKPRYEYPEQWDVCDLELFVWSSLHQLLAIIGTCYQNIVLLDLKFGNKDLEIYDISSKHFISSTCQQLGLFNSYAQLSHEVEKPRVSYHVLQDATWVVENAEESEVAVKVDVNKVSINLHTLIIPHAGKLEFGSTFKSREFR